MVHWINVTLTHRRLNYALITGAALWMGWLLSLVLGPGLLDLAGQPVGTDYLPYYAVGKTLLSGDGVLLYDLDHQFALQQRVIGPELGSYYAAITPPFLAGLFVPFALLPYAVSFAVYSVLSVLALAWSLRLLDSDHLARNLLWSLTWFPIFATVSFGENSALSLLLLAATFVLWRKRALLASGLVLSLLLYKPQLALGVVILWALDWRRDWRALLSFALGGGILVLLCFTLLPDASWAYLDFVLTVMPNLPAWHDFPLWHLHTVRGFWRLLLPNAHGLADGLTLVLSAVGLAGFVWLWKRRRQEPEVLYAAAICLTLWLTPHAMVYDWAIALIPALLLWRARPDLQGELRAIFALFWVALLLSGPLTLAQLRLLPFALQISVVLWGWALVWLWRRLRAPAQPNALA